jgi:hypothetical protein
VCIYTTFHLLSKYCILFCLSKRRNSFVLIVCSLIKLIAKSEYRRPYRNYVKGGGSGIQTSAITRDFIFSTTVQTGYSAHTVFYSRGTGIFPGIKWPGREADHSPSSSAEMNEWSYTTTPSCAFMASSGKIVYF